MPSRVQMFVMPRAMSSTAMIALLCLAYSASAQPVQQPPEPSYPPLGPPDHGPATPPYPGADAEPYPENASGAPKAVGIVLTDIGALTMFFGATVRTASDSSRNALLIGTGIATGGVALALLGKLRQTEARLAQDRWRARRAARVGATRLTAPPRPARRNWFGTTAAALHGAFFGAIPAIRLSSDIPDGVRCGDGCVTGLRPEVWSSYLIGASLGATLGISIYGEIAGMNGAPIPAFIGSTLGAGLALAFRNSDELRFFSWFWIITLPTIGATIGYNAFASAGDDWNTVRVGGSLIDYDRSRGLGLGLPSVAPYADRNGASGVYVPVLGGRW